MSESTKYVRTSFPTKCTTIIKEIPISIVNEFYNRATESVIDYDWNNETIDRELRMSLCCIGGFIDYYLRHEIAKTHHLELEDRNAEFFEEINCIRSCYEKFKNKQANIKEIYITSLSLQMACGCPFKTLPRASRAIPKGFHFNGLDEWAASLTGTNIMLQPWIGSKSLQVLAYTSLIVDDEIIVFKFLKKVTERHFMQLLIYAACYKDIYNTYVDKVSILNTRYGKKHTFTLSHQIIDDISDLLIRSIQPQQSKDVEATEQ